MGRTALLFQQQIKDLAGQRFQSTSSPKVKEKKRNAAAGWCRNVGREFPAGPTTLSHPNKETSGRCMNSLLISLSFPLSFPVGHYLLLLFINMWPTGEESQERERERYVGSGLWKKRYDRAGSQELFHWSFPSLGAQNNKEKEDKLAAIKDSSISSPQASSLSTRAQ